MKKQKENKRILKSLNKLGLIFYNTIYGKRWSRLPKSQITYFPLLLVDNKFSIIYDNRHRYEESTILLEVDVQDILYFK